MNADELADRYAKCGIERCTCERELIFALRAQAAAHAEEVARLKVEAEGATINQANGLAVHALLEDARAERDHIRKEHVRLVMEKDALLALVAQTRMHRDGVMIRLEEQKALVGRLTEALRRLYECNVWYGGQLDDGDKARLLNVKAILAEIAPTTGTS